MSLITVALVDERVNNLRLSLHGLAVWRQYRVTGLQRSLLSDLYGDPARDYNLQVKNLCEVLVLFQRSDAFRGLEALAAHIQQAVALLPSLLQRDFKTHWFMLHREVHDAFFPDFVDDEYFYTPEFAVVKKFLTLILNPDAEAVDTSLRAMLTPIWFDMCDAALTVYDR